MDRKFMKTLPVRMKRSKRTLERMNEEFPSLEMLKDQASIYVQGLFGGWSIWRQAHALWV